MKIFTFEQGTDEVEFRDSNGELVVDADFARKLELELKDAKVERIWEKSYDSKHVIKIDPMEYTAEELLTKIP